MTNHTSVTQVACFGVNWASRTRPEMRPTTAQVLSGPFSVNFEIHNDTELESITGPDKQECSGNTCGSS
ncbi:hypothetical protein D5086_004162 [Populus alba]|uniref:Uncharacterized protein n=1 Tax=Populus alba TaxID=43335 RepID=A0ACC4CQQ0_POPAL